MPEFVKQAPKAQSAWVVFSGQADLPWLKIMKPGFRHCFVLLNDGQSWSSLDPMLHHMDMCVHHHVSVDFDLPSWLESRGLLVVPAYMDRTKKRPAPYALFSCVEVIKRILGIHTRFIFTPWQLYRHLMKMADYESTYQQEKGEFQWEH